MSREIEEFMDNEAAYNVLRHACYIFILFGFMQEYIFLNS